jgi:branched-chain amino acid transport system substrate-binding protein
MLAPRHRRATSLIPVIVSLTFALTACERGGGSAPAFTARDTVYIGVASTRQPDAVSYGYGVRLAVEHLNAQRPAGAPPFGVRLSPVEQPSQVQVAAYFRDDPAVIGVVGHTGSGQTMEAAPVYGDVDHGGARAVVAISPTATNPAVTRASPWVFRVCPTDNDAARALARYAADSLKARRIALIFRNDLFGRGFTRTFVPELEGRGARIIERDPYLANVIEWDAYAERLARRGTDAVVLAGGAPDAANFIRALRRAGFSPMFLGTDDVARLGVDTASRREFAGVRFTAFYRPPGTGTTASTTPAQRFASEYRERYKEIPDHQAALSYDAAMLIGRAALAVGPDRRKVRDWISAVGRTAPSYDGITGEIRFDEWGDAVNKPVVIDQVRP